MHSYVKSSNFAQCEKKYCFLQVLILDGRTGRPLSTTYKTSAAVHSSPLTVSMEGSGNDLFLFWSADCTGHEHEGGWYEFVNGTNVHESSRADTCMLRYNTKSFSKFYVTNRRLQFPGKEIYFSSEILPFFLLYYRIATFSF